MKKTILALLAFSFLLTACSSSNTDTSSENSSFSETIASTDVVYDADLKDIQSPGFPKSIPTADGVYTLELLQEGNFIFYNDFSSMQQTFLCSSPNCNHNDETCTSYSTNSLYEFAVDNIYINYDNQKLIFSLNNQPSSPTVNNIYFADLSGGNRELFYETYDDIDLIAIGENNVYFKRTIFDEEKRDQLYEIVALNLNDKSENILYSFYQSTSRQHKIFIENNYIYIAFRAVPAEFYDPDNIDTLFSTPETVGFTIDAIDVKTGETKNIYFEDMNFDSSFGVLYENNYYFYVNNENENISTITELNLTTKEERVIYKTDYIAPRIEMHNVIDGYLSMIFVNDENTARYYRHINIETGGVIDITLNYETVSKGGFTLEIKVLKDLGDNLFVVIDEFPVRGNDDLYYQTALISKEDYFNNNPNYILFDTSSLNEHFN